MPENKSSYLVIARKYRPQTFDDLAGQEPIATTLKNAITLKKIAHAYLFCGPRGVGKTSTARIFAKALNCVNGPTVEPCGKCTTCVEIENSRALDVLEIDGASNRGIDEIRALRENVRFAPAAGKYKIYIIDEVHQITTDGFNALLKTLEEPPAHVKFIFATTSAQKVPATILSRCQRFDFRRITAEKITEVLREICKNEKIKVDDEALYAIAKAADGSLRDSQTILDQIAASSENKITRAHVIQSLGVLEEEHLVAMTEALGQKDAKKALEILDAVLKEGKDPSLFVEKLLEHVRNLMFAQVSPDLMTQIDANDSYRKDLMRQKDIFSRDSLFYFFQVLTHTFQILKRFDLKRIPLEIALIRLAEQAPMQSIAEVLEELRSEKKTNISVSPSNIAKPQAVQRVLTDIPAAKKEVIEKPSAKIEEGDEEDEAVEEELPQSDEELSAVPLGQPASLESIWPAFIQAVRSEKISAGSYLSESEPKGLKNGMVTISFPVKFTFFKETLEMPDNKRLVEKHLTHFLGGTVGVQFVLVKGDPEAEAKVSSEPQAPRVPPEEDPTIKSAMNMFGGRITR
jgi:DNA polymerase-3 subunit gamma/tau